MPIRLQIRDQEILKFILEQKFASLEHIYFAFFDKRESENSVLPKNFWTVRQRLNKLKLEELLKVERVLSSSKGLYLITPKGRRFVESLDHSNTKVIEAKRVDFSLYEHDYRATMIRSFLIKRKKYKEFYSEKVARANKIGVIPGGWRFSKELIPDGVFITSNRQDRVALEFELTRKSVARVEEKIRLYERYFGRWSDKKILDKVWIIVKNKSILRVYERAIKGNAESPLNYRLDLYEQIIPELSLIHI